MTSERVISWPLVVIVGVCYVLLIGLLVAGEVQRQRAHLQRGRQTSFLTEIRRWVAHR